MKLLQIGMVMLVASLMLTGCENNRNNKDLNDISEGIDDIESNDIIDDTINPDELDVSLDDGVISEDELEDLLGGLEEGEDFSDDLDIDTSMDLNLDFN